jgi:hypothetical protein
MLAKSSCQHCKGLIEFDLRYAGKSVKCRHCFEITKLIPENQTDVVIPLNSVESKHAGITERDWANDPVSEKQRAMLALYSIELGKASNKGEASKLIDDAIRSNIKPPLEGQILGGVEFAKIRLKALIEEVNSAIKIIGCQDSTIASLKEAKKRLKVSLSSVTEIIDKRIGFLKDRNLEIRAAKAEQWLKENGHL